ncbi:MAG: hypothetical protein ACRDIV_19920, partial [Ktedonobacteraceae bacterium]
QNGGGQQSFQSAPAQPSGSLYAPQPAQPPFNSGQGIPVAPSAQGSVPGGYAGSYNNAYQNPYAANPGNSQGQQMPGAFNGGQGVPGTPANAKPGKRSFLDTIREWFHL